MEGLAGILHDFPPSHCTAKEAFTVRELYLSTRQDDEAGFKTFLQKQVSNKSIEHEAKHHHHPV